MSAKRGILKAKWAVRFLNKTVVWLGAERGATATEYSLLVASSPSSSWQVWVCSGEH
ncbi:hypothetical protein AHiyo8_51350 [Arthrobacter sp. Hiyo8]|nr:hypothetical protein AHiyo8_51350 [Arthrobacter sp. Hiyo8]